MIEKSLTVLKDENLPSFKENALARAKEFDISEIMPLYEDYYDEVLAATKALENA